MARPRPALHPRRGRRVAAAMLAATVGAGLLGACGGADDRGDAAVTAVASGGAWADIAGQIGGPRVAVRPVGADPGTDPHLFTPGARDAAAVASADLAIVNGLGYDDAVARLAAGRDAGTTLVVADVLGAPAGANPHLWYDVERVPEVARAIADAFTQLDPAGHDTYTANLVTFLDTLQPVIDRIEETAARHTGTRIANTERVAGYLLDEMGLVVVSPAGYATAIEEGVEPSASDTRAMSEVLRDGGVALLVYNEQAESAVTEAAARTARDRGVPVVGVTETIPRGTAGYQAWQGAQVDAIRGALER